MWKTVKLGDVLKTGAGGTPLKSKKSYYEGGDIKWLLSGAVCEKDIHDSKTHITEEGLANSSAKLFPNNTVLVAMYGATAGQVGILRTEAATNQAVCGIYPSADYLPMFLYYYLSNYKETLLLEVSGVAQPNLSQVKIKNIPVPLISLAEQQRIVAKLDAAFAAIEIQAEAFDKKLAHANRIRLKIYQKIIAKHCPTQKKVKLNEMVDERCKLSYGIVQPGDEFDGGLPVVRPVNLKWKHIKFDDLKRINPSKADGYQRTKLIGDEVLLSVRGSTGIVSLATQELAGANVTRGIIPILFNEHTDTEFGYYALQAESVQNQIKAATYGATLQQINVKDVKTLLIDVPPYDEQLAALKEIKLADEQLNLLIEIYTEQLRNSDSLKSAILEKELQQSEAA